MRGQLSAWIKSINDLSMFPESVLYEEAFADPVAFGRNNSARIAQLVDTANLSLSNFEDVEANIATALSAEDPWVRYWGLIVLSSFGEEARSFIEIAQQLARSDEENLVRVRAAEFLALIDEVNPEAVILDSLANANNEVEAVIILNSVVLLRDFKGYEFSIDPDIFPANWRDTERSNVNRRLAYLLD